MKTSTLKRFVLLTLFLSLCVSYAQEEGKKEKDNKDEEKETYTLINHIIINNKIYDIKSKPDKNKFSLKICKINDDCRETGIFVSTVSSDVVTLATLKSIGEKFDSIVNVNDTTLIKDVTPKMEAVLTSIRALEQARTEAEEAVKAEEEKTKKAEEEKNEAIRILNDVDKDEDQYAGVLSINDTVPYKIVNKRYIEYKNLSKSDRDKIIKENIPEKYIIGTGKIVIKKSTVHFFNNKASDIYIEAEYFKKNNETINDEEKQTEEKSNSQDKEIRELNNKITSIKEEPVKDEERIDLVNRKFSIPIRYFDVNSKKNGKGTLSAKLKDGTEILIEVNDVFNYGVDTEKRGHRNYSIANREYYLSNDKDGKEATQKIKQRGFFDFFTGVIFSDVLALNTENSNSLLTAQAKLLIPLNQRNSGRWTLARQITTSADISLNSSFEDESRFISVTDDETFSNFDLFTRNNLFARLSLDVLSYEAKGFFTNISLGYHLAFLRTGARFIQTIDGAEDDVLDRQLFSLRYGPYLNFEIRPQSNFGADFSVSLENLNFADSREINGRDITDDNVIVDNGNRNFIGNFNTINAEASFYWLTSSRATARGGIFARLGATYHTETRSIFPQIMVGYATNLTSFVNRFIPEEKTPDIPEISGDTPKTGEGQQ